MQFQNCMSLIIEHLQFLLLAVAYTQIDWHDFVVVETVDYQPNETGNLPPPTTPDEVGARLLQQQRFEDGVTVSNKHGCLLLRME